MGYLSSEKSNFLSGVGVLIFGSVVLLMIYDVLSVSATAPLQSRPQDVEVALQSPQVAPSPLYLETMEGYVPHDVTPHRISRHYTDGAISPNAMKVAMALGRQSTDGPIAQSIARYISDRFAKVGQVRDPTEVQTIAQSVIKCSELLGVDWRLILAVMETESSFRPEAVSYADARGLMQVHFPTWNKEFDVTRTDLHNIPFNIYAGTWILRHYLEASNGNVTNALYRYYGTKDSRYVSKIYQAIRNQRLI